MLKKPVQQEKNSKRKLLSKEFKKEQQEYTMVVFCHLRWEFVYQRPQHLISRMAKDYKILFIEEPIGYNINEEGEYQLEIINENLHILKPRVKDIASIKPILEKLLKDSRPEVAWFYSAAFSPLLADFNFEKVVYDCMDELSLFKGAAPELMHQEKFLISEADVIFTGGKSLYESKEKHHNNVHCFPSSVEREHFEKARTNIPVPGDIENIKSPIVGYFGVIDERINLDLLHKTALLQPEISFVMIGPLAKIGEEDLPREENIHYLGMKSYKELPNYLKAFDIAMMPFALNDATKFISPTKTLEYMAAGKPIISTAIKDVQRDYSHCIPIVATAEEFAKQIKEILNDNKSSQTTGEYNTILNNTSWDSTAAQMKQLLKTKAQ
ncbi:glycosyltransferase [Antarcticibacterium sp. 1MA-6-2]|uniref:glycosyltransferase n=1 Tax=Antarcticibacterium sp. 1MA-6-2 TaxID=2908210 RepID=UPI001F22362F|nr:glycosyltransferase [Antarcticibacterium sp. 1MA-6-2]UJH92031.1 glycosyltransferase [Antarcticibacterium sp. 1MA-6-2]